MGDDKWKDAEKLVNYFRLKCYISKQYPSYMIGKMYDLINKYGFIKVKEMIDKHYKEYKPSGNYTKPTLPGFYACIK